MDEEQQQKLFTNIQKLLMDLDVYKEFLEFLEKTKEKCDGAAHFRWLECI